MKRKEIIMLIEMCIWISLIATNYLGIVYLSTYGLVAILGFIPLCLLHYICFKRMNVY